MKTYAYSLTIPITANYVSVLVAPLVVLPDRSNVMISHMCMPGEVSRLQHTVNFFSPLFRQVSRAETFGSLRLGVLFLIVFCVI